MEYMEFSAKTVQEAITDACTHFVVASDRLDYEVIEEGSTGFLGIGSKAALIKARVKEEEALEAEVFEKSEIKEEAKEEKKAVKEEVKAEKKEEKEAEKTEKKESKKEKVAVNAKEVEEKSIAFLKDVLHAMDIPAVVEAEYNAEEELLDINLIGDDMGILIGKRGQTLDSLQYLVSLVVNKNTNGYIRVKVDTENYRSRRKATLENLARNIAAKVKRTRRPVSLEPMNPYERRIIHSALQNDKYVTTHSEGEEPYRKVVVTLKK
ncbi:MAG: protein jag [Lachnospiraceae bacterium]|nr:protein jag [Lachnospiraceae bacterium]